MIHLLQMLEKSIKVSRFADRVTREEEDEEDLALLSKELAQLLRRYQGSMKALSRRY